MPNPPPWDRRDLRTYSRKRRCFEPPFTDAPGALIEIRAGRMVDAVRLSLMLEASATLIVDWLREIGLTVRLAELGAGTFLPGVTIEPGGIIVDPERLLYPGDLLHEAGHLAVMAPAQRAVAESNAGSDMGDEIAAQTWSYAAAVHLGLPAEIVFHASGYKGAAETLIGVYRDGKAGVPLLQWMGLTLDSKRASAASVPAYPHMIRWLRGEAD
ncbi:MAG: hypothetical protein WBQ94_24655 [Terracidiphilus sp.]